MSFIDGLEADVVTLALAYEHDMVFEFSRGAGCVTILLHKRGLPGVDASELDEDGLTL